MTVEKAVPSTRPGAEGTQSSTNRNSLTEEGYPTETPPSRTISEESLEKSTSTLRDLYASSYIIARGLRPVEVQPQGRYFLFVFPDPPQVTELLYEFTTDGLIEIRDFIKALRWLKAKMRHISKTTPHPPTRKDPTDAVEQHS